MTTLAMKRQVIPPINHLKIPSTKVTRPFLTQNPQMRPW